MIAIFNDHVDTTRPLLNSYQPKAVEAAWYAWWEESGFFKPRYGSDGKPSSKGTYVIPIPPPNITGSLHLGHGLTNAIQDALIRYHRMRGYTTVYVPGCDHAGISTQVVVEKKIWRESKKTRHDLGREKFIEQVWDWREQFGSRIYNQLRRLGSSYDWSRACFTMDPKFANAVTETFVKLHDEGIIYRDTRLVNWCCKLNTALSNLEVENKELEGRTLLSVPNHDKKYEFGVIISFSYPVEGSDQKVTVATTRIETMLGDVAVAVHPQDSRYTHLIGKNLVHPFNGRKIPILADDMVEMEFGTGAVKITPAHDPNDYLVGKRHNLAFINILNDDGTLNENGGIFKGMKRFDARNAVVDALKERGLYVETKPNKMVIPICSRTGDIVEPLLKPQWYVNCQDMAKDAIDLVKNGELNIYPVSSEKEWYSWMEGIQDWCISRQLWWGHTIPAYFVNVEGQVNERHDGKYWVSAKTLEEAQMKAYQKFPEIPKDKITLEQDPDVLDTWFSSALWPFAIFGWPETTEELENFYPNSLLETGWDILFFWVARMVFFARKLTGKVPFKHVFCHAMVRDAHGRKMSKSLGNVIDPIDIIQGISLEGLHAQLEKGNLDPKEVSRAKDGQKKDFPRGIPECGTDALRFALCAHTSTNRDINLDILRVEGYRKFCNKLWNATKFALMKLGDDFVPVASIESHSNYETLVERWILHRLNEAIKQVHSALSEYNFMNATTALHKFWLYELCDVYVEAIKPIVDSGDEKSKLSARQTLYTCLDQALRLLHPFMPFITEELFQRLPRRENAPVESIMIAEYPDARDNIWKNETSEQQFELVFSAIKAARSIMTDYNLKNNLSLYFSVSSDLFEFFSAEKGMIETLCLGKNLDITIVNIEDQSKIPNGCAIVTVNQNLIVNLLVRGKVDFEQEIEKLRQKFQKKLSIKTQLEKQINIPEYENKVAKDVRESNQLKLDTLSTELNALKDNISNFERLRG